MPFGNALNEAIDAVGAAIKAAQGAAAFGILQAADPLVTGWWLNDIPGEFAAQFEWKQTRGTEPYMAQILCSDERFAALNNPVRLTFMAPSPDMKQSTRVTFENLWIVDSQKTIAGLWVYTIADLRWRLGFGALTKSYNIRSYGGNYRLNSVPSKGQPWKRLDAVQDALETLIANIENEDGEIINSVEKIDKIATQDILNQLLPDNLGNSDGGGWVGAGMAEFVTTMLGDVADLIVTRAGRLRIIDRSIERQFKPDDLILFDGELAEKEIRWQKPRRCVVQFERRRNGVFDVESMLPNSTAINPEDFADIPQKWPLKVENVIPRFAFTAIAQSYVTFPEFLSDPEVKRFGITRDMILGRLLAQSFVEQVGESISPELSEIESLIREHWLRTWRIKDEDGDLRRNYSDIQLGRLLEDGTTDESGVVCDHVKYYRRYDAITVAFTENFELKPSPFIPRWINRNTLTFRLEQAPIPNHVYMVLPGNLALALKMPDRGEAEAKGIDVESLSTFFNLFRMKIEYNALYVGDTPELPRLASIETPLFQDGEVGHVTTFVDGVTANERDVPGEQETINGIYIHELSNLTALSIKESYRQERAGLMSFGGLEAIKNLEPLGDIFEVAVVVGGRANWTIDGRVEVRPNIGNRFVDKIIAERNKAMKSEEIL